MREAIIVYCTVPNQDVAAEVAESLVRERLAACVNAIPGVQSTYRWQGNIETEKEILLMIKSTESSLPALRDRIVALHPYDLPEVLAVKVDDGLGAYLSWVGQEVG